MILSHDVIIISVISQVTVLMTYIVDVDKLLNEKMKATKTRKMSCRVSTQLAHSETDDIHDVFHPEDDNDIIRCTFCHISFTSTEEFDDHCKVSS